MPKLLIVDDEHAIRHAFRRAFRSADLTISEASTAEDAVAAVASENPDVVVLDVHLPDVTGLETFHRIRGINSRVPILLITGHGTTDLAIEAIKAGAFDYLLKPLDLHLLRDMVDRAVRSSQQMTIPATIPEMEPTHAGGDPMIGRCPAMQAVYKAIGRVAGQDVTVLITGETGTGKELVARAIYQHSFRAHKPFIAINCGAIPETLIESELFGHERGAFTGADRKRIGRFEQANGGTLFLDEIADLPPSAQVKLLRVLQEKSFERVGGHETISTDVRIIAATNADLSSLAQEGEFRQDLLFRLQGFSIHLPPLRDRGEDIALLIKHCVHRYGQELNKPVHAVSPEVLEILQTSPWPGNIRQLQSVIKQAILEMRGDTILPEDLPTLDASKPRLDQTSSSFFDWDDFVAGQVNAGTNRLYAQAVERMEQEILFRVLKHTNGNQLQAAKILGITRGSLRNKLRSLGIKISREIRGSTEGE